MYCADCGVYYVGADGLNHPVIRVNEDWFQFCSDFCKYNWIEEEMGITKDQFDSHLEEMRELN